MPNQASKINFRSLFTDEQPEFFERLKQLVELAYFLNNRAPVVLLGIMNH